MLEPSVNPFSTKFWIPGEIPYQFGEEGWDIDVLIGKMMVPAMTVPAMAVPVMQIVGQHGSGKSTLLRTIQQRFEQQHLATRLEVLNDRQQTLPPDFLPLRQDTTLYMIDGYEQLAFLERVRLRFRNWRRTGGLLLTTHQPVSGIPILYRTTPQFELFVKLVQHLTKTQPVSFGTTELRDIFDRASGNFRTAFFELYDMVQEKKSGNKKMSPQA
ncbi:MAG: hypothetical protein LBQ50_02650 [Planctomycetaceae bacterium]|nr:hypothetical protein [Planctomycetaceae bacterium]